MSPMVFNIMIDAVIVRHWEHICLPAVPMEEVSLLFHIDEGALTGMDAGQLQATSLDASIASGFESFGLLMNASKTEFMVMSEGKYYIIRMKRRNVVQCDLGNNYVRININR